MQLIGCPPGVTQVYLLRCGAGVYACHSGMMLPANSNWPLKIPACTTGVNNLAQLESAPEKFEIRPVAYARAPIHKRPVLPALFACAPAPRDWLRHRRRSQPRCGSLRRSPPPPPAISIPIPQTATKFSFNSPQRLPCPSSLSPCLLPKKDRHNRAAFCSLGLWPAHPAACSICSASMSKFE